MDLDEVIRRMGGVATRGALEAATSRAEFAAALADGTLVRVARGRYASCEVHADVARAHAVGAVLSHESAALQHGWPVLLTPKRPHVSVPANRKVPRGGWDSVEVHRAELAPDDVAGCVTTQERTLADCLRNLEFRQALAVADSSLREGNRSPGWMAAVARDLRGPGSARARLVASLATPLAHNPFESGLRAIAHGVEGLDLRAQVPIFAGGEFLGRPDGADVCLKLVAEADSFEWHGGRADLVRDAQRYNAFVVHGWMVLRFTWEDVMLHPEDVRATLEAAVDERSKQSDRCP